VVKSLSFWGVGFIKVYIVYGIAFSEIPELPYNLDYNPREGLLRFAFLAYPLGTEFLYTGMSNNSLISYVHIFIVFILTQNICSHNEISILIIIRTYIHIVMCFKAYIHRVITTHMFIDNL